jgi:hypothetical protein
MTIAPRTKNEIIPTYIGLTVVSFVLRLLGWIGVALALIALALAVLSLAGGGSTFRSHDDNVAVKGTLQLVSGAQGIISGVAALISAFFMVGFGEVFVALRDIARNSFAQRQ